MSNIILIFLFHIHLLCWVLTKIGQTAQFEGGSDIYQWEWAGVKIHLCPNLGEGVLKDQKRKICPFFSQLIENQKLYNTSENQPPKSIMRGDMGFHPHFDLKKVLFLPYLPSKLS